jgi:hypothetical protein
MTKLKMIPTFLVLGALGIAAWMFAPSFVGTVAKDRGEALLVTVDFTPANRITSANGVYVQAYASGVNKPLVSKTERDSPFSETVYAKIGSTVTVTAQQSWGGTMACKITHKGDRVAFKFHRGIGVVTCEYMVVVR